MSFGVLMSYNIASPKSVPEVYIAFGHNLWELDSLNTAILLELTNNLKGYPKMHLKIKGYHSTIEKDKISLKRAKSIRAFLKSHGCNKMKIEVMDMHDEECGLILDFYSKIEKNIDRLNAIKYNRIVRFSIVDFQ